MRTYDPIITIGSLFKRAAFICFSIMIAFASFVSAQEADKEEIKHNLINAALSNNSIGQYQESIMQLSRAIAIDPKDAASYAYRGSSYVLSGNYEKAVMDYTMAIDLDSSFADAYYNRGLIYDMQKSEHTKAIRDFTKTIEIDPGYLDAYFSRAAAYAKIEKYDEAIADYTKVILLNPRYGDAFYGRAVSYYHKKEYDKAWDDVKKAEELGAEVFPAFLKNLSKASGKTVQGKGNTP